MSDSFDYGEKGREKGVLVWRRHASSYQFKAKSMFCFITSCKWFWFAINFVFISIRFYYKTKSKRFLHVNRKYDDLQFQTEKRQQMFSLSTGPIDRLKQMHSFITRSERLNQWYFSWFYTDFYFTIIRVHIEVNIRFEGGFASRLFFFWNSNSFILMNISKLTIITNSNQFQAIKTHLTFIMTFDDLMREAGNWFNNKYLSTIYATHYLVYVTNTHRLLFMYK